MSPADLAEVDQWSRATRHWLWGNHRMGEEPLFIEVPERMYGLLMEHADSLNDMLGADLSIRGYRDMTFRHIPVVKAMPILHPDPFVRTIVEKPLDDGPRLVYADWLEEHGDPRGEFIRVQCKLAKIEEAGFRRPAGYDYLLEREDALFTPANKRDWSRPLGEEFKIEFARGFVSGISCTWSNFLAGRHVILGLHPIRWVTLDTLPSLASFVDPRDHCMRLWIDGLPGKFFTIGLMRYDMRGRPLNARRTVRALLRVNFPGIRFNLPAIGEVPFTTGRRAQRQGSHEVPARNPARPEGQPGVAGPRSL
jgi:uncharacterized protein (TIGR02996 family)